jgi:hypothetical protein
MKPLGKFDSSLQMFVQQPLEVNLQRLRFMRWLAERGKLEHGVAGPPSGPLLEFAPAAGAGSAAAF